MSTTSSDATVADTETRLTEDDHDALRVWLRLLTCTNVIETEVRQRLHRKFGMTLPRFDFLAQLERVPDGLRMGELSQRMMVTSGNVTGIATALEEEGLVDRQADPKDRRIFRVKLTEPGRRTFQQMAAAHESWIAGLLEGFGGEQQEQLNALLAGLKRQLTTNLSASVGKTGEDSIDG